MLVSQEDGRIFPVLKTHLNISVQAEVFVSVESESRTEIRGRACGHAISPRSKGKGVSGREIQTAPSASSCFSAISLQTGTCRFIGDT